MSQESHAHLGKPPVKKEPHSLFNRVLAAARTDPCQSMANYLVILIFYHITSLNILISQYF